MFHWCSLVFTGVPLVFTGVHWCSTGVHWCSLVFHWCSLVFTGVPLVFIGVPLVWCFRLDWNAIVPFHLRSSFWNAKIDCSHENGTIAYRFLFLFTRERNRSVSEFFLQSLPFFLVTTTSSHALRETNLIVPFLDQF